VQHVASHPAAVWLVGPFFAAVTGVAFKEGLCYGKAEAAGLFFITPLLLLGHLTGWIPEAGQTVRSCDCLYVNAGYDVSSRCSRLTLLQLLSMCKPIQCLLSTCCYGNVMRL